LVRSDSSDTIAAQVAGDVRWQVRRLVAPLAADE
jgi:hypothetical protein